jgi:hypothetical protein
MRGCLCIVVVSYDSCLVLSWLIKSKKEEWCKRRMLVMVSKRGTTCWKKKLPCVRRLRLCYRGRVVCSAVIMSIGRRKWWRREEGTKEWWSERKSTLEEKKVGTWNFRYFVFEEPVKFNPPFMSGSVPFLQTEINNPTSNFTWSKVNVISIEWCQK